MLYIYILVYKLISFNKFKMVSPVTFVNKKATLLILYNVWRTSATSTLYIIVLPNGVPD